MASQRLPQNNGLWHQPNYHTARLADNREPDRPRSRPQFLVAMSFRHSANWRNQAAGKGFDDTASARCIVDASQALPRCVSIVQQLSRKAAGALCFRRGWRLDAAACDTHCSDGDSKTQKTAPDARKMDRICTSTWRSTHLGRMYDDGAPGLASERLS
ncbi:hypothetical protein BKA58DRAFT_385876 [Alternaria rosae]|uniref:uncharacterized protein n=1 Tax=Alternaria rosae TaxID=1187941 RepID=UPI001E8E4418|nr:uncharacterized protein BKA58DRAFT_385876 [Alternaria rosae]KAH6870820.1 hypothetical protein BKA58DRAFT_385876 [Alternaria rosae]